MWLQLSSASFPLYSQSCTCVLPLFVGQSNFDVPFRHETSARKQIRHVFLFPYFYYCRGTSLWHYCIILFGFRSISSFMDTLHMSSSTISTFFVVGLLES